MSTLHGRLFSFNLNCLGGSVAHRDFSTNLAASWYAFRAFASASFCAYVCHAFAGLPILFAPSPLQAGFNETLLPLLLSASQLLANLFDAF